MRLCLHFFGSFLDPMTLLRMQRIMRGISKSFKLIDVSFLSQKSRNLTSVKAYDLTVELIYPNKQMCLS